MKFLESSNLESLNSDIQSHSIDCSLDVRIEAYSCKMVAQDKKQWKQDYEPIATQLQALSPPEEEKIGVFPVGRRLRHLSEPSHPENDQDEFVLLDSISTKSLFDLKSVLNLSFPDYDFSDLKSSNFSLVSSFEALMSKVDEKMTATVFEYNRRRNDLWARVKTEIKPEECIIYTLNADYSVDPFTEDGCLWSFNYFLCNKTLKRLLFISCRAFPAGHNADPSMEPLWEVDA